MPTSPARQRAYKMWARTVPNGTDPAVFHSAFEGIKERAAAALTRELTINSLSKACGRPPLAALSAALQELIDENVVREVAGMIEPRYAPARVTTPATRKCRRIWVTDDELVAVNNLLESMRCPAKT